MPFPDAIIPLQYHCHMLSDAGRMEGFRQALARVIPPHGRVVDLGGGTGVLSFFAARKAARVYCVEAQPDMARLAGDLLAANGASDRVTVICADARNYVPPEPVDVVVCEMLHSALLRERQVLIMAAFRAHYAARFGPALPVFVPEATLLACQPVEQDFDFSGYRAPVPLFLPGGVPAPGTRGLGDPQLYAMVRYGKDLPERLAWQGEWTLAESGRLNAVRFITKNALAVLLDTGETIDWHNQCLVMPLAEPLDARAGQVLRLAFDYAPGDELPALGVSLRATVENPPGFGL